MVQIESISERTFVYSPSPQELLPEPSETERDLITSLDKFVFSFGQKIPLGDGKIQELNRYEAAALRLTGMESMLETLDEANKADIPISAQLRQSVQTTFKLYVTTYSKVYDNDKNDFFYAPFSQQTIGYLDNKARPIIEQERIETSKKAREFISQVIQKESEQIAETITSENKELAEAIRIRNARQTILDFALSLTTLPDEELTHSEQEETLDYFICINSHRFAPEVGDILIESAINRQFNYNVISYLLPKHNIKITIGDSSYPPHAQNFNTLKDKLEKIILHLTGNEIEIDTSQLEEKKPQEDSYWNKWGYKEDDEIPATAYKTQIHPTVVNKLLQLMSDMPESITWMDIFGGEGRLINQFTDSLKRSNIQKKIQIYLFDRNRESLYEAKKHFGTFKRGKDFSFKEPPPDNDRTFFEYMLASGYQYNVYPQYKNVHVHEPIDLIQSQSVLTTVPPPNFVTAVGGLNQGVVTKSEAITVAKSVFESMQKGGIFIVTGYSPCLLNAKDFAEIGFTVKQMTIPENIQLPDMTGQPIEFYVLEK